MIPYYICPHHPFLHPSSFKILFNPQGKASGTTLCSKIRIFKFELLLEKDRDTTGLRTNMNLMKQFEHHRSELNSILELQLKFPL